MYDLLIVNGIYPDFAAGEMVKKNIGVSEGKIAYIGDEQPEASRVIDAEGKVVSPGFIDIHMHEENFGVDGEEYIISNMMLEMGVTTAVGGNCGNSRQPLKEFKRVLNEKGGAPVNYIMLAGYNSCRVRHGYGKYDTVSPEQQIPLLEDLKADMAEGAYGISFGIEYDPAITFEEMINAIKISDDPHHIVTAHYRDDSKGSIDAINEMIRISESIPQKFQISHLSSCSAMGTMDVCLKLIDEAMERNPKLDYDTYPYAAFSTRIGSAVFDDGCFDSWGKTYEDILLTSEPYRNVRCTKEIFEDARANYPTMLAVAFVMNEDEIRDAVVHHNGMVASDALLNGGKGHPRAAGTFPRVLGKYVREEKAISLIDALSKMTIRPADRLELAAKGRIEIGCDADITIFDPETIIDGATFSELKKPEGIEYVFIGGQEALRDGDIVNGRLGRFMSYFDR